MLEENDWNQSSFAERMGYTEKHISLLINGKAPITEETAFKLERVVGQSAAFWLTREVNYREAQARLEEEKTLGGEGAWLKELPLRHMLEQGWVAKCQSVGTQVAACLRFFGVASVDAWRASYKEPIAAFRASKKFSIDPAPTAAWLRHGERVAAELETASYDRARFRDSLAQIRALTLETDPKIFAPQLQEICAAAGVVVVFEKAPKGCPVSGATKWLSPSKALLMLSLRHKTNDHLWFSFFHEAGHLLLHGKKMMFIDIEGHLKDEQEEEANEFARDALIPASYAKELASLSLDEVSICAFARRIGINPAIVVGRLQNEGRLAWKLLTHLKTFYSFDE